MYSLVSENGYVFLAAIIHRVYHLLVTFLLTITLLPVQEGLEPVVETSKSGDHTQLSFILPSQSLGTFPDIEPHFDSFPRLFDTLVRFPMCFALPIKLHL